MPENPVARIRHNLVGLRMPRALEALEAIIQQIERGQLGALEAIDMLLAEEITVREGRRIKAALQMARLATIKTLAGFDFSFQPSLDRNRIMALASLEFIDRQASTNPIEEPGPKPRIKSDVGHCSARPHRMQAKWTISAKLLRLPMFIATSTLRSNVLHMFFNRSRV